MWIVGQEKKKLNMKCPSYSDIGWRYVLHLFFMQDATECGGIVLKMYNSRTVKV